MAITFVGYHGTSSANTVATTNQVGDLLLVRAYRTGNGTAPSLPASGWNDLGVSQSQGGAAGTQTASRAGWRIATATNEGSGVWSNAGGVEVLVFRGMDPTTPIGNVASAQENTARAYITYPAINRSAAGNWFAAFGSRLSTGANADVATNVSDGTTTLTNRGSQPGTPYMAAFAAEAQGNWTSTNASISGTAYKYNGWLIEINDDPPAAVYEDADGRVATLTALETGTLAIAYALASTVGSLVSVTGAPEVIPAANPYEDVEARAEALTQVTGTPITLVEAHGTLQAIVHVTGLPEVVDPDAPTVDADGTVQALTQVESGPLTIAVPLVGDVHSLVSVTGQPEIFDPDADYTDAEGRVDALAAVTIGDLTVGVPLVGDVHALTQVALDTTETEVAQNGVVGALVSVTAAPEIVTPEAPEVDASGVVQALTAVSVGDLVVAVPLAGTVQSLRALALATTETEIAQNGVLAALVAVTGAPEVIDPVAPEVDAEGRVQALTALRGTPDTLVPAAGALQLLAQVVTAPDTIVPAAGTLQALAQVTGDPTIIAPDDPGVEVSGALQTLAAVRGTPDTLVPAAARAAALTQVTGAAETLVAAAGRLGSLVAVQGLPEVVPPGAAGTVEALAAVRGTPDTLVSAAGAVAVLPRIVLAPETLVPASGALGSLVSLRGTPIRSTDLEADEAGTVHALITVRGRPVVVLPDPGAPTRFTATQAQLVPPPQAAALVQPPGAAQLVVAPAPASIPED